MSPGICETGSKSAKPKSNQWLDKKMKRESSPNRKTIPEGGRRSERNDGWKKVNIDPPITDEEKETVADSSTPTGTAVRVNEEDGREEGEGEEGEEEGEDQRATRGIKHNSVVKDEVHAKTDRGKNANLEDVAEPVGVNGD